MGDGTIRDGQIIGAHVQGTCKPVQDGRSGEGTLSVGRQVCNGALWRLYYSRIIVEQENITVFILPSQSKKKTTITYSKCSIFMQYFT